MREFLLFGRVIVRETGAPVPNLMVSLFEADASNFDRTALTHVSDAHGSSVSSPIRLGTAITDQQGAFDLRWSPEPSDDRPDVLLAVFAPLTSDFAGATPPPPKDRLLHYSKFPRVDIGQSEGFVISLSSQELAAHGIHLRTNQSSSIDGPLDTASLFGAAISRSLAQKEKLSVAVAGALQSHTKAAFERRAAARRFAANFSALPRSLRSSPFFVPPGLDPRTREQRIWEATDAAVAKGLEDIEEAPAREILLYVPESRLQPWREIVLRQEPVPLEVTCGLIRAAGGGVGLHRSRSFDDLRERLKLLRGDGEPGEPGDGEPEPPPEDDDRAATITERIKALVEQQVADVVISIGEPADQVTAAAGMEPDEGLKRSTLLRVREELQAAELAAGPADTTAYHDFHAIQLAYPEVWIEALHPDLGPFIELAYHFANQVVSAAGGDPGNVLDDEIDDLDHYLNSLSGVIETVAEAESAAIPQEVRALWPDIEAYWHLMRRDEQAHFIRWATPKIRVPKGGRYSTDYDEHEAFSVYNRYGPLVRNDELVSILGGPPHVPADLEEARSRYKTGKAYLEILDDWSARASGEGKADDDSAASAPQMARLRRLLREIKAIMKERYSFEYYAENSYNFGIIATYRQKWEPGPYQVGDMAATVPLAPGERRRFEITEKKATSRSTKELERAMWSRSGESTLTTRASTEIVRRAEASTNFAMNSQGSFSIGQIATIGASSSFARNQSEYSQSVKNDFREAVVKASHEYRNERSLNVDTSITTERESVTAGELHNPNNEIPVTYLLYELERRYDVSEQLHRLQPVILVAQKMPDPGAITESWLLRHEWILRRVLLDDGLRSALDALHDSFAGEELSVAIKRANWEAQLRIVQTLEGEQSRWLSLKRRLNEDLVKARYRERVAEAADDAGGFLFQVGAAIGGSPFEFAEGKLEAQRKMFEDNIKWVHDELQQTAEKLAAAQEALDRATRDYSEAIEQRTQQRTQIDQLRIHVKDNILHYMQAIWSHEPTDQRYFRLHNVEVKIAQSGSINCRVRLTGPGEGGHALPGVPSRNVIIESCDPPTASGLEPRKLHQIADLDNPLGFKGNYMIFPLRQCEFITDFMMREYVDSYFGIRDPDALAEFKLEELIKLRAEFSDVLSEDEQEALENIITLRLSQPWRDTETIIVPTGQLYMEALVGTHSLLEPFKLAHRAYDAARAREELRRAGLENLRYAARLVGDEPLLEDPETETRVEVRGTDEVDVDV